MSNKETSMSTGEFTGMDLAPGVDHNCSPDPQPTTAQEGAKTTGQHHVPATEVTATKEQQTEAISDSAKKKATSANISLRNQRNSKRSTGPRDTRRTRHNALRHGLRASGLTRFDDTEEYVALVEELTSVFQPRNGLEKFLVENLARDIVRYRRATRMEADGIEMLSNRSTSTDQEPGSTQTMLEPIMVKEGAGLLDLPVRYGTAIMNQVLRLKRELERRRDEDGSEPNQELNGNADLIN